MLRLLVGIRFQVLFHSPPGVLFTFPSRYWFTIGGKRYLALGGGPPGFPQGFSCPVVLGIPYQESCIFRLRGFHPLWPAFPAVRLDIGFVTPSQGLQPLHAKPHDPHAATPVSYARHRFRLFRVRSPLLGESLLFSLPPGTKMFQFARCPPATMYSMTGDLALPTTGFPHSDISGSKLVCSSPKRFAADRVLRRPFAPRHPPYALRSLTKTLYSIQS